jgi:predicted DNA-binding transcriptional regulator YafY
MSKFSNLLNMIILLKSRGKMKCKDIAEELEVDERQVRKYKRDLELAGINITSTTGIDGGYSIDGYDHLLNLNINDVDLTVLNLATFQLKSMNFPYYREFTWNDDESVIFEATMSGKTEIVSWVLSMGSKVKVLAPEELKIAVKEEIDKIKKYY